MKMFFGQGHRVTCIASLATLVVVLLPTTEAWGGLFNRFNPSMLSNLGYGGGGGGGGYGKELYGVSEKTLNNAAAANSLEEALERRLVEAEEAEDPCFEKRCTANEHCCEGHVCVDTEDENNDVTYGTCLPIFGKKQGEGCGRDSDCESGFLCLKAPGSSGGQKSCQAPTGGTQGLGEDCRTSNDCNIQKGLCCKLQRRAKSQPKKICTYFTDPQVCVGAVATSQVLSSIEHTAGEKRLSGHPDYHHLRK